MRLRELALLAGGIGGALLAYGALFEARRLTITRRTIALQGWPQRLSGFKVAVLGDLHLSHRLSVDLGREAVEAALAEGPDAVAIVGDLIGDWYPEMPRVLRHVFEPLLIMEGRVVAVPGNHDWKHGPVPEIRRILDELNIRLLQNESWRHGGVTWVGVDSFNKHQADPERAMAGREEGPAIALWHEPDVVDRLPKGCALMLSGHSHGGQFRPLGITPMRTRNGRRYLDGFFPGAPTPLFVTRGVGTTFFPSRFNCPPEVAVLTLVPA
jgi:uncharacterized protein